MSSLQTNDTSESKQTNEVPLSSSIDPTNLHLINICNYAYGLCIGAAIGDSIGSYCEFSNYSISKTILSIAMEMPGGGTWGDQVTTGQVTDDTELAISLSYGLLQMEKNKFDVSKIAIEYNKWNKSLPFDRGLCTREVLHYAPNVLNMKLLAINYDIEKSEQYKSDGNLANGSLMRCMPLILYGYKLKNLNNLYLLMKSDSELTHRNIYIYIINTCYAIIILYLLKCKINEKNKHLNAYNKMYKWLKSVSENKNDKEKSHKATIILNEWLKHITKKDISKLHPATKFKGFIKIAFQRVCYHLYNNNTYYNAIKSVVGEGGDSDTNACIVGGVIGALNGLNGIPKTYIENIHKCNPLRQNRDRFQAKWYFKKKMIEKILENAPNDEEFIKNFVEY
eukprot:199933_1